MMMRTKRIKNCREIRVFHSTGVVEIDYVTPNDLLVEALKRGMTLATTSHGGDRRSEAFQAARQLETRSRHRIRIEIQE
jgi:hypothetical protein